MAENRVSQINLYESTSGWSVRYIGPSTGAGLARPLRIAAANPEESLAPVMRLEA